MNPKASASFAGARCRQLNGICILRPSTVPKYASFMLATSNLHFRIARDPTKDVVCIQNKQTIDVDDWSPVEYIWCAKGDRGSGDSVDFHSWLDVLTTAPSVPINKERRDQLDKYLTGCAWRLDDESQLIDFKDMVRHMHTLRPAGPLHWEDGGQFSNELNQDIEQSSGDEAEEETNIQILDRNCIIGNQHERRRMQNQALINTVSVGSFIAYKPFYKDTVPSDKRKPMYIGKVLLIDRDNQIVQIKSYITGSMKPLNKAKGTQIVYKPWRGNRSIQDVNVSDIYHAFTPVMKDQNFTLTAKEKDAIVKCLAGEAVSAVLPAND